MTACSYLTRVSRSCGEGLESALFPECCGGGNSAQVTFLSCFSIHDSKKVLDVAVGCMISKFQAYFAIKDYEILLRRCSIPDDRIDPRRSAFFMARSVLGDIGEDAQC
jgi:hypothetical protein